MKKLTEENLKKIKTLEKATLACLTEDLRYERFRGSHKLSGFCYPVAESLYHLIGKELGFKPMFVRMSQPHWFLEMPCKPPHFNRRLQIDPCHAQFSDEAGGPREGYPAAKGKGFLTKQPSKRAQVLIERVNRYMKEQE